MCILYIAANRYMIDMFWYINYMLGYDVWDHSEHVVVVMLVALLGMAGCLGMYNQALALASLLQPLGIRAIAAVVG